MKWRRITILQTYILLFAFDAVVYLCVLRFLVSLLYIFLLFSVRFCHIMVNKLCGSRHNYAPPPVTLTFDLLTLEVVSESRVTCMVYLNANFSLPRSLCSRLRPDVRDRQTDVRQHHCLTPAPRRREHNKDE